MAIQWKFNPLEGETSVTAPSKVEGQEDDLVMYIDELNPEVIAKIVEMHNDGKTTTEIDAYLADEERCTEDEREFIMEQLVNYAKLSGEEEAPVQPEQPAAETNNAPAANTAAPQQATPAATPAAQAPPAASPQPSQQGPAKPPVQEQPKKPSTPRASKSSTGKMNTEDFIKSLQEKIELTRLLDATVLPDIPTGLTKAGRELMVEYQKEQEALTDKYIGLIQKM